MAVYGPMVHRATSDPSPTAGAEPAAEGDADELQVEAVATLPGDPSRVPRVERLHRLALELRVVALEAELERAERRHAAVIEHYERILADRERNSPVFSWLDRR